MNQSIRGLVTKFYDHFEIQSPPAAKFSKPRKQTPWRWVALIVMNIIIFGDFVALEGPQPIEDEIQKTLKIDETKYSMLYSSWALPSIFTPFVGGYLIDKLGVRPTLILFSLAVTIGQFIYTFGGYALSFPGMIVGRVIFAMGTDPLNVAQIVITNKWFQGKESAFAVSVSGVTFGLGRAFNSFITPIIYNWTGGSLGAPMMFASVLCLLGTIATFIMVKWDKEDEEIEHSQSPLSAEIKHEVVEKVSLSDLKYFGKMVWLLILYFGVVNGCSFSFNAFANKFYHERFSFSSSEAGTLISVNFVVLAIAAAFFGKLVDKIGMRATMTLYNSLVGVVGFLYFFIAPNCYKCFSSMVPQLLFGLQLGICEATLYSSLPLVLEEKYLGTGYGLFFVVENILVLVLPGMAASIKQWAYVDDKHDGYSEMNLFFFLWNCVVVYIGFKIFRQSKRQYDVLDRNMYTKLDNDETRIEEASI